MTMMSLCKLRTTTVALHDIVLSLNGCRVNVIKSFSPHHFDELCTFSLFFSVKLISKLISSSLASVYIILVCQLSHLLITLIHCVIDVDAIPTYLL